MRRGLSLPSATQSTGIEVSNELSFVRAGDPPRQANAVLVLFCFVFYSEEIKACFYADGNVPVEGKIDDAGKGENCWSDVLE